MRNVTLVLFASVGLLLGLTGSVQAQNPYLMRTVVGQATPAGSYYNGTTYGLGWNQSNQSFYNPGTNTGVQYYRYGDAFGNSYFRMQSYSPLTGYNTYYRYFASPAFNYYRGW